MKKNVQMIKKISWSCGRSAQPTSLPLPRRPAPLPVLAAELGPIACPSRSARHRNCPNLPNPEIIQNKYF